MKVGVISDSTDLGVGLGLGFGLALLDLSLGLNLGVTYPWVLDFFSKVLIKCHVGNGRHCQDSLERCIWQSL